MSELTNFSQNSINTELLCDPPLTFNMNVEHKRQ